MHEKAEENQNLNEDQKNRSIEQETKIVFEHKCRISHNPSSL